MPFRSLVSAATTCRSISLMTLCLRQLFRDSCSRRRPQCEHRLADGCRSGVNSWLILVADDLSRHTQTMRVALWGGVNSSRGRRGWHQGLASARFGIPGVASMGGINSRRQLTASSYSTKGWHQLLASTRSDSPSWRKSSTGACGGAVWHTAKGSAAKGSQHGSPLTHSRCGWAGHQAGPKPPPGGEGLM